MLAGTSVTKNKTIASVLVCFRLPKLVNFVTTFFDCFWRSAQRLEGKENISIEEQTRIMLWVQEGMSTTEITARLGCHPAAVQVHVVILKRLMPLTSTQEASTSRSTPS
jgi:hypothetical protein